MAYRPKECSLWDFTTLVFILLRYSGILWLSIKSEYVSRSKFYVCMYTHVNVPSNAFICTSLVTLCLHLY